MTTPEASKRVAAGEGTAAPGEHDRDDRDDRAACQAAKMQSTFGGRTLLI